MTTGERPPAHEKLHVITQVQALVSAVPGALVGLVSESVPSDSIQLHFCISRHTKQRPWGANRSSNTF